MPSSNGDLGSTSFPLLSTPKPQSAVPRYRSSRTTPLLAITSNAAATYSICGLPSVAPERSNSNVLAAAGSPNTYLPPPGAAHELLYVLQEAAHNGLL